MELLEPIQFCVRLVNTTVSTKEIKPMLDIIKHQCGINYQSAIGYDFAVEILDKSINYN